MDEFDKLEIELKTSLMHVQDDTKVILDRLQLVRDNWVRIANFWRKQEGNHDREIEKLKALVIYLTETVSMLDPVMKEEYWRRLNDVGFYDDGGVSL